ncbi:MAG: hypothetical protein ABI824_08430 [Acidobacteriota bacterium]
MAEFFAQNWGNLASVVGLVFSFLAFIFSKRASRAAEAARDSVLRRSLSQDMSDASRLASDIAKYVRAENSEMSVIFTEELWNQTSYYVRRWDRELSEQCKIDLDQAREQLALIQKHLRRCNIGAMNPRQKTRLTEACQTVNTLYHEVSGVVMKATDKAT